MVRILPHLAVAALAAVAAGLVPAPIARAADAGSSLRETGVRVLGAARGYATAALWLRAGDSYARGDFNETRAMYQLIREIQPRNPAVYSFQSWNEGYNLSAQFPDLPRREEWIKRGLNTLHDAQAILPREASLRLDEWHYMLSRTQTYPLPILRVQAAHYRETDPTWASLCDGLEQMDTRLTDDQHKQRDDFLEQSGLNDGVYENTNEFVTLINRPEFKALDIAVQAELAYAHWLRWHCMVLVLEPTMGMPVRSVSCDGALMLSYLHAHNTLPSMLAKEFDERYRNGARRAYKAGIENARRAYGERAVEAFKEAQHENFADLPGWIED